MGELPSGSYFNEEGVLVLEDEEREGGWINPFESHKVSLPLGNEANLEVPSLACLLGVGASREELVSRIWRHPDGPARNIIKEEGDWDYCYEWALRAVRFREEAVEVGYVCKLFGGKPSEYIGITDRYAAYILDMSIAYAFAKAEAKANERASK